MGDCECLVSEAGEAKQGGQVVFATRMLCLTAVQEGRLKSISQ